MLDDAVVREIAFASGGLVEVMALGAIDGTAMTLARLVLSQRLELIHDFVGMRYTETAGLVQTSSERRWRVNRPERVWL